MANLFWGVSDALDLYEEYMNAKKLKAQKSQKPRKKVKSEADTAQKAENEEKKSDNGNDCNGTNISNEDVKVAEVTKDCKAKNEKGTDEVGAIEASTEKNDLGSYDNDGNHKDTENGKMKEVNIECAEKSDLKDQDKENVHSIMSCEDLPSCTDEINAKKSSVESEHVEIINDITEENSGIVNNSLVDNEHVAEKSNLKVEADEENLPSCTAEANVMKSSLDHTALGNELFTEKSEVKNEADKEDVPNKPSVDNEQVEKINENTKENLEIVNNSVTVVNNNVENLGFDKDMELCLETDGNKNGTEEIECDCLLTYRVSSNKLPPVIEEETEPKDVEETCTFNRQHQNENQSNFQYSFQTSIFQRTNDSGPAAERLKSGEEPHSTAEEHNPKVDDENAENNSAEDEEEEEEEIEPHELNILIFGGGDPRHVIKTMAKRYVHRQNEGTASSVPTLKFYIIEGCMEIVARNILLLGIALERPELISLRNKVHLFMDVYGNSLLRPICHQYLVSKAVTLLKMVSDKGTLEKIAPFVNIDNLKYSEIDALQDAFEFWQPKPGYDFNIKEYWMGRIRQLLAVRYDVREGVFDWDLNMSLKDRGGEQICSQEYRYWRETGIAFTFPEYEQCKPNKTLSAGLVRNGGRYIHRGYIGDIQTGPFCTFGLRSAEERMHHSAHGENDYRATDITERNLLEYFHEIQSGTPYVHNDALSHKYGGVRFQMGERLIHDECDTKNICAYDQPWIDVEGTEVHILPQLEVKKIGRGAQKWQNFFDIAFVGYKFFEFVEDDFPKTLRENSLLILETKLRSVEIKTRITEFENELLGFAHNANLQSVLNYSALNSKNSILKFWKPEKPTAPKKPKKIIIR